MLYVEGWDGMDGWMVIIGYRPSKSIFGKSSKIEL